MPRGASTRTLVEARFVEQGIPFRPFLEVQNLYSIARFVKAGCGTALLPLLGAFCPSQMTICASFGLRARQS